MIKYAIFDLDGTLCDTLEAIRYYVNITIEEYGARPISREECRTFVGSGAKKLIERVMSSRGMSTELFDEIFEKYKSAYDANPYHLTKPYEGITEMLEALSSAGIGLAVLSNKQDGATQGAVKHFFDERFSAVFGGRDGVPLKPDKAAFDMVLDELSASADEVAYVGDSDVDVLTIKAADPALGIAVSWGFRTREELISSGAELILDTPMEVAEKILSI